MDFNKIDERSAAEKARPLHLRDTKTGEPLMSEGKPCLVMVKGVFARSVQATLHETMQEKLIEAKGQTGEDQVRSLEDIQRELGVSAGRITAGFENIYRGKRKAKVPDDLEWFFDLNFFSARALYSPRDDEWQNESFAQQVLKFSGQTDFLGLPSGV